eukprot:Em0017g222a
MTAYVWAISGYAGWYESFKPGNNKTGFYYQNFSCPNSNGGRDACFLQQNCSFFIGRDKFVIATKFGVTFTSTTSGKPELIRSQLADSLQRLGTDYIDLYYQHRMDPGTPIEETMECLKQLVQEGKIRYVGFSDAAVSYYRSGHVHG